MENDLLLNFLEKTLDECNKEIRIVKNNSYDHGRIQGRVEIIWELEKIIENNIIEPETDCGFCWNCPRCKGNIDAVYHYCPTCGAKIVW